MDDMLVEALCYADDVTLLAPTGMAMNGMIDTCAHFDDAHNLLFRPFKTKCMFLEKSVLQLRNNVRFLGKPPDFVCSVYLLGVQLCVELKVKNNYT